MPQPNPKKFVQPASRSAYVRVVVFLFYCLTGGACASFESVRTVGKIGATLADYKPLNTNVAFLCESIQNDKTFAGLPCDSLRVRYTKINAGIDVLTAYSDALLLATKSTDFNLSDIVGQVAHAGQSANWLTVSNNQVAGAQSVAQAIQKLVGNGLKRKNIRTTVQLVAGNVDTVCLAMLNNISLQKQAYSTYQAGVQVRYNVVSEFQKKLAGKDAENMAMFNLNNDVLLLANKFARDEVSKLSSAEKIIESFRVSHKKLAEKSSLIGRNKDIDLQHDIIDSIKGIFTGIETFKTPVK